MIKGDMQLYMDLGKPDIEEMHLEEYSHQQEVEDDKNDWLFKWHINR